MSKSKEKEEKEKTATFRIGSSIGKIFNKKDKQRAETLHSTVYSSSPHQQPPSSSSSLAENGGEEAAESGVLPEESPLPEEMSIYMKEMQETAARARTSTMKARLNDVVLSGFLLKLSSNLIKGWRKHWCVLERDELLYYKNKKDLEPAGKISMFLCSIKVTKNNGFDIATPNLVHHFQAENAEQQNEWVNRMQKLSEGLLTTPTLRRTREDRHTVSPNNNKIKHQVSPEPTDLAYSARMPTSKSSSALPTTSLEESPRVKQRKAAATVSTTSSKNKSSLEKKAKERGSEREKEREEDKKKEENAKGKDKSDEMANLILEQRTEAMRKRAASRGSMFKIRRHSSRDCVNGDGAIPESLAQFAALPENHICVECGDSEPRWVSINLGVFLCLVCSGIHRSLGVHISKIRSLDLDMWTEESVKELVTKGNAAHRKVWEEDIPPSWRTKRPSPDDTYQRKEKWIRAKYILRKFSREGKIYPSFKAQVSTKQKKPINYLKLPPIGVNSWIEGNSVHLFGPTTASCQDYYKQTVFCRSVSLFPKNPQRQHCHHNDYEPSLSRLYDPLVQCYGVQQHHNVTLLALAAGCNWGKKPFTASRVACTTFLDYIKNNLHRIDTLKEAGHYLLRAFAHAHTQIIERPPARSNAFNSWEKGIFPRPSSSSTGSSYSLSSSPVASFAIGESGHSVISSGRIPISPRAERKREETMSFDYSASSGSVPTSSSMEEPHRVNPSSSKKNVYSAGTTTLIGGMLMELSEEEIEKFDCEYIFVCANVGNCKCFLYDPVLQIVTDVTSGNLASKMDERDLGGRIGPYVGPAGNPDLRNLGLFMLPCKQDSIIMLLTPGVYDNLDPEYLGLQPSDVDLNNIESWSEVENAELGVKESFRCEYILDIISSIAAHHHHDPKEAGKVRPKDVVNALLLHCKNVTKHTRHWSRDNPSHRVPKDYLRFPGRMDHASAVAISVGNNDFSAQCLNFRDKESLMIPHPPCYNVKRLQQPPAFMITMAESETMVYAVCWSTMGTSSMECIATPQKLTFRLKEEFCKPKPFLPEDARVMVREEEEEDEYGEKETEWKEANGDEEEEDKENKLGDPMLLVDYDKVEEVELESCRVDPESLAQESKPELGQIIFSLRKVESSY